MSLLICSFYYEIDNGKKCSAFCTKKMDVHLQTATFEVEVRPDRRPFVLQLYFGRQNLNEQKTLGPFRGRIETIRSIFRRTS